MNLKQPRPKFKGKNAFIKSLSCAAAGMHNIQCCEGLDEAHYKIAASENAVRDNVFPGANCKNDRYTLPLCRFHHDLQHSCKMGEKRFWGDKPVGTLCDDLHDAYLKQDRANAFMALACFIQMPMVRE